MLFLEQYTTREEQINMNMIEFEAGNSKEFGVEIIWDSIIYANKAEGYLSGPHYLVVWNRYPKEENT